MTDYAQLAADNDPKALKAAVNLAAAVLSYNIILDPSEDGRLTGQCPFHDDDRPSFGVWQWPDGQWACGCWACDFGPGDLFDFLQRWHDCDFRQAMAKALELRDAELPEAPEVKPSDRPATDMGKALGEAKGGSLAALENLLHEREVTVPPEWLHDEFRVEVTRDGTVLIPHFNEKGELHGIKRRAERTGWCPMAAAGSRLDELYGIWRAKQRKEVIICEGESDTWTVAYLLRDQPVDVIGLPSGVKEPRANWLDWLRGRDVTVLFDADRAGRECAGYWVAALAPVAHEVHVACLPDGTDATSAGSATTLQTIAEAWPFVGLDALPVGAEDGRYVRFGKDEKPNTLLSDFVLKPQRLVVMDDGGIVFEVDAPGKMNRQLLTGAELAGVDRMRRWATDRLLSWKGNARDLSDILELLKAQSILVPRVRGTDVAGLHENAFVLPDDLIGASGWGYVPPENDISIGASLRLDPGSGWDRSLPLLLMQLHAPEVLTPILGWIAAAPLRSTVGKFPVLAVTGGSGWGKTTLIATILQALGFWMTTPTTLTGATAHGIHSYVGSTNAFPIWVDEYRPGARIDAKLALDQIIRDSWDGSATIKGGMSENRMKIKKLPARAPLIVTGEDSFSETSHAERMVMVAVSPAGRNPQVLEQVQAAETDGFGRTYLEWLLAARRADTLPAAPNIPDRPRQARAVAAWGYELLDQFCREVLGYTLPVPFVDTEIRKAHAAVDAEPVIIEAIQGALDLLDKRGQPIAWRENDNAIVKPQSLCLWAKQETDLQMPGGSKAVTTWLVQKYGAYQVTHATWNRVWVVPGLFARPTI